MTNKVPSFAWDKKLHEIFQEDITMEEKVNKIVEYTRSLTQAQRNSIGLYDSGAGVLE